MWDEASNPNFWNGVTLGGSNAIAPKYVFDRVDYVNIGGGSVSIGANIDVSAWPSSAAGRVKFATFNEFEDLINDMMNEYNSGWTGPGGASYGDEVVRYSHSYPPAQPSPVFP